MECKEEEKKSGHVIADLPMNNFKAIHEIKSSAIFAFGK